MVNPFEKWFIWLEMLFEFSRRLNAKFYVIVSGWKRVSNVSQRKMGFGSLKLPLKRVKACGLEWNPTRHSSANIDENESKHFLRIKNSHSLSLLHKTIFGFVSCRLSSGNQLDRLEKSYSSVERHLNSDVIAQEWTERNTCRNTFKSV